MHTQCSVKVDFALKLSPSCHCGVPLCPTALLSTWGFNHSIIRSHCGALPLFCPTAPHANGTNLYSLSALMSSHAERLPYHKASGSHHLSPSPADYQAQHCDWHVERVRGWVWRWTLVFVFMLTLVTEDRCALARNQFNKTTWISQESMMET